MDFARILAGYKQDILRDIGELVRIPSVRNEESTGFGCPFGAETAKALEWYLDKAKSMGFKVKNVDGYAGHVEYGEGAETLGILVHLDVVPPGSGWSGEPFEAAIDGDKLVGRGVMDNKGPAIIVLYALKALKESGAPLDRNIRIIAGTDEESGMNCVEHYFKQEKEPDICFSPDGDFPLIHGEKGLLQLELSWQGEGPIRSLRGGSRPNMVPEYAQARIQIKENKLETDLSVTAEGDESIITALGKAAHASLPERGSNAIIKLLRSLCKLDLGEQGRPLRFLAQIGPNGEGLDLQFRDDLSGRLTSNLGQIEFDGQKGTAILDIRSPVTCKLEDTLVRAQRKIEDCGFTVRVLEFDPPHFVPKESELVQTLLKVYRDVTGDSGEPLAIGGATYARRIKHAVAFGPQLPGREDVAHTANEYIYLEDIWLCLKIYFLSIWELAGKKN